MVLAAGLGLRMRPLSLLRAKPVLPVLNRPLLNWTLARLARQGVTDVVVNLHHLPASVRRAVGDGRSLGLRVRYSFEPVVLGRGGGPRKVRRFFGDAPALIVNGDVLFDFDLKRLLARHQASGASVTLGLKPNPDPRRYGSVVTARDGRVLSLAGRPRPARGTAFLFTGVHVVDPRLLERLPPGPSDSLADLWVPLLREGERVEGVRLRGGWYDLGTPSLYLAAQLRLLPQGRSLVHPRALIERGARLRRAVVGAGARVAAGARVERSVLWDGVRIGAGARVRGSVIAGGSVPPRRAAEGVVAVPARLAARGATGERVGGQLWAPL